MLYLDTSLLVAVLTNGAETERMQHWLEQQPVDDLALSDWVATEFSSALSIKLRTGQIGAAHRADALATFTRTAADSFTVVPVSRLQFRTAARFADQHTLGLRAGGAFHLAVCAGLGATLRTFEQRLSHAGSALGVKTILLHTRCLSGGTVHRGCS
jgi:predicted nucleic acid-binding protein